MADTLYLSLWYPNLRLEALPDKLIAVLGAFAAHGGEAKVYSATVWPVSWNETPVFQRVYGRMAGAAGTGRRYRAPSRARLWKRRWSCCTRTTPTSSRLGGTCGSWKTALPKRLDRAILGRWARGPRLVRVTGYGPLFDEGAYEQDGHIRIDFGTDTPFLEEDADLDQVGARHVEENVRQLVELTAAVEKASGATARLLWSELGESLAQRLAARLGMGN